MSENNWPGFYPVMTFELKPFVPGENYKPRLMTRIYAGREISIYDNCILYKKAVNEYDRYGFEKGLVSLSDEGKLLFEPVKKVVCAMMDYREFKVSMKYELGISEGEIINLVKEMEGFYEKHYL